MVLQDDTIRWSEVKGELSELHQNKAINLKLFQNKNAIVLVETLLF